MGIKAFITGCAGRALSPEERDFIRRENPWGLILFQRNCDTPDQIKYLTSQFRDCVGRDNAPILIDQEGGRVQRLKPPLWPSYAPSNIFAELFKSDPLKAERGIWLQSRLIANDLYQLGINVDCLPVLDVPQKDADQIIGDRAYSENPDHIIKLAKAAIGGLMTGGVLPVMKHIPGHGRALCDSHLALPRVKTPLEELQRTDFLPFQTLSSTPLAMTAHIVYECLDKSHPATQSATVISSVIRGKIGFTGALMTDDLSMKALSGSLKEKTRAALDAGCDLALHCNGNMSEMREVAEHCPILSGAPLKRTNQALNLLKTPDNLDEKEARDELNGLLKLAANA